MKVYLSIDLEGICGTTHWDEVTRGNERYAEFQKQMTAETVAACKAAMEAGATEVYVRDGHDSAKNIMAEQLPESTLLIRGWSRHPYMMMQELDQSFDAALMIGYHSLGGSPGNPLAHTMASKVSSITINGLPTSEFLINSYTAAYESVPVVFVSGDHALCEHAREIIPNIKTVAVKYGTGDSTVNMHPHAACGEISETVKEALSDDLSKCLLPLPESFEVISTYRDCMDAYKCSFFPGAGLVAPNVVKFESSDYFEVLKFFLFTL